MRKIEAQHNEPEQVREYLSSALAMVEELAPPEDLRVALFAKAVDLFSSKQVVLDAGAVPVIGRPGSLH